MCAEWSVDFKYTAQSVCHSLWTLATTSFAFGKHFVQAFKLLNATRAHAQTFKHPNTHTHTNRAHEVCCSGRWRCVSAQHMRENFGLHSKPQWKHYPFSKCAHEQQYTIILWAHYAHETMPALRKYTHTLWARSAAAAAAAVDIAF